MLVLVNPGVNSAGAAEANVNSNAAANGGAGETRKGSTNSRNCWLVGGRGASINPSDL
jgi:hypothetical protein